MEQVLAAGEAGTWTVAKNGEVNEKTTAEIRNSRRHLLQGFFGSFFGGSSSSSGAIKKQSLCFTILHAVDLTSRLCFNL